MQQILQHATKYIIPFVALSSCICHKCGDRISNNKSEPFIHICKEFKSDVEFARTYKYIDTHPLAPSEKVNYELGKFVDLTTKKYSKNETEIILGDIKREKCDTVLKDLSILAEEQMENKAVDDFIKYYSQNKITKYSHKSILEKIEGLQNLMKIKDGYSFVYLKNYFVLIANELEMVNNLNKYNKNDVNIENFKGQLPDLKNKYVTFVGAGFPLSGISINILTGAKINLIDIDEVQLKKAKDFLNIISKSGIINIKDFSFTHADGQTISYSNGKIKTDILHFASALPKSVKTEIFKNIQNERNRKIIIDRYVSGIFKLLYDNKVYSKEITSFKAIAKIYPENLYNYKKDNNRDIIVKPTSVMNVNSSRLLILKETK
jgi:hypothetical protein